LQGRDSLVFGFDGERFCAALGADSPSFHLWDVGADVNLRHAVDALCLKGSMVNAGAMPCPLKGGIRQLLPPLAQVVDGVFLTHVPGHVVRHEVKLSRLVSKASALYAVRRGQDVRVRVALSAFLAVWCMDCHVCGNAIGVRDALRKFKG
jgi:hypothetical protein